MVLTLTEAPGANTSTMCTRLAINCPLLAGDCQYVSRALGADVPLLGAILVTHSGRTATADCRYVSRALGADVPPLGAISEPAQSGRTAIDDCQYVSRVLGADMPLRCNSRQYS